MTKNPKEVLYVKHVASMKNGVLVLSTRNREDVVAFGEVVRRSDDPPELHDPFGNISVVAFAEVVLRSDEVRWSDEVRRSDEVQWSDEV